jgi:uncharacterized protein (TIGR00266 family)
MDHSRHKSFSIAAKQLINSKKKTIKNHHHNKPMKNRHNKHTKSRSSITINDKLESFGPNIFVKHPGNKQLIPKFHIVNSPSFASVVIYLAKGQSVFCNYGSLNYMDSSIDVSTRSDGFFSGLIRSFFTTTSMFLTYYTGMTDKESVVSFSSFIPGDIIAMKIKPGEKYIVSQHGFLAASANILISTTTKFKNIFVGGDLFLNEISCDSKSPEDGIVWISAYGGFDKITVNAGESVKVDRGLFALAKKEYDFSISTIGNVKSYFLSGNTMMMNFRGPCELYVHSNNLDKYLAYLSKLCLCYKVKHQQTQQTQPQH